jgi:hypothetical protein
MIGQTIPAQQQHHTVLRLIARRRHVNCPLDGSAEQAEARYAHGVTLESDPFRKSGIRICCDV